MRTVSVSDECYHRIKRMADSQLRNQKTIVELAVHKYYEDNRPVDMEGKRANKDTPKQEKKE